MSRSFKSAREFIPVDITDPIKVPQNSGGFLDIVAKFGPLLIAIIAVAFCFYIYKKVLEMDKTPNTILESYIQDQTQTNLQIQESYNAMVEQFNNLSGVVHTSLVKNGTIETQISPPPSIINESLINDEVDEVDKVDKVDKVLTNEIFDDISEISVSVSNSSKPRRGKKSKNEVNL